MTVYFIFINKCLHVLNMNNVKIHLKGVSVNKAVSSTNRIHPTGHSSLRLAVSKANSLELFAWLEASCKRIHIRLISTVNIDSFRFAKSELLSAKIPLAPL